MDFKSAIVVFSACLLVVSAAPAPAPSPNVVAPLVAAAPAAVVTAHSSQVIARNYNGFAAPLVAAPAPVIAAASPYVAAPAVSPLVASPYAYASPFYTYY